jgi:hypothetical protein
MAAMDISAITIRVITLVMCSTGLLVETAHVVKKR